MSYWKWWYRRTREFVILGTLIVSVYVGLAFTMYFETPIPGIIGSVFGFSLFFGTIARESYKNYLENAVKQEANQK